MKQVAPPHGVVRFSAFEVDLRNGEVRKHGHRIRLQEQPFHVLQILLEHPGELVTREELQRQVWPADTFVDFEKGLNNAIRKLRDALSDSAEHPRFIETRARHGYRFVGSVNGADGDSLASKASHLVLAPTWPGVLLSTALALVVAIIAGGLLWRTRQSHRLTEKDTIVLAHFTNTTGDPVFDGALKQGLRVQLEQSPFLNIVSHQKVEEELRLMRRSPDQALTLEIGLDLCQRVGSKAILAGSISSLGTHYVIGLTAWNCQNGDEFASEQTEADKREHVLKALGESATNIRKKLGESLSSIQQYDVPVSRTTSSLEALKAYGLALEVFRVKGETAALPFLNRAVELDPNFAVAYGKMATFYSNLGEDRLATGNAGKAYELRETVSEPERLYIESHYYDTVTGDLEKAAQVYGLWQQLYPRDREPRHNLIGVYSILGKFDDSLQKGYDTLHLFESEMGNVDFYFSIVPPHIFLNQFDKAESLMKQAEEHKLESAGLLSWHYVLAFVRGDAKEMEQVAVSAVGKRSMEGLLFDDQACAKAYHGRLRDAREVFRRSVQSSLQGEQGIDWAASSQADASLTEAYLGDTQHARRNADAVLKLALNRFTWTRATLSLALAGDTPRAEKLVAELNEEFPLDTELQRYWLPTIRAAAALDRGNAKKAAELLGSLGSHDLTPFALTPLGQMDATYVRGEAYLMLRNGTAAAAEFERILDHPGLVMISPVGALARLGLARAYAFQGDAAKARAAYQDFLNLWKDADPDIPILLQAKAEYAKLK